MKYLKLYKEYVNPKSVVNNITSIQSIIDNKRAVGTIALHNDDTDDNNVVGKMLHDNNINAAKVPNNKYLYIIFKEENRKQAQQLVDLYTKQGGTIGSHSPKEVRAEEGRLLGYSPVDINNFLI